MRHTTSLHANPFFLLGVTSRDDRRKIVEKAEERALHLDHDTCQKARADLTNPKSRLSVEMAWMPGVAPTAADRLVRALPGEYEFIRSYGALPELAQANLMAAAIELIDEGEDSQSISEFIRAFAWLVEAIDADKVLRDINEDRAISGFPEITRVEAIEEELNERRKSYRSTLKLLLDSLDYEKLIATITDAVSVATDDGKDQGPALIDELTDAYELETQSFLEKESENISKLVASIRLAAPHGHVTIAPLFDKLERVARNWDRVAQPIQLSAKSRGTQHRPSCEVAYELRSLGIELNNEHNMLEQAHRMTTLLQELFAELPDVVERLEEDAETIGELRRKEREQKNNQAQWARDISFKAEVGLLLKDQLSVGPNGICWKGSTYPLESITRVRWGGVSHSVNGIPTGTTYMIGFGDSRSEQAVDLRKESTYSGFLESLWQAVCVRLIISIVKQLEQGLRLHFGDIVVEDGAVTLTKHKSLFSKESIRLAWHDVHVWSANGRFVVGAKNDKM